MASRQSQEGRSTTRKIFLGQEKEIQRIGQKCNFLFIPTPSHSEKPSQHVFVDNVDFSDTHINRFLHSSSPWRNSLGKFPSLRHVQKKNRPEKCPFIPRNNWIVSAVRRYVHYFFAPNSPIFRKSSAEEQETSNFKALCFTSNRKKVIVKGYAFDFNQTYSL